MKEETVQRQLLNILYNAGFHFTVTNNSIEVIPSHVDDKKHTVTFLFDKEDEDLVSINPKFND